MKTLYEAFADAEGYGNATGTFGIEIETESRSPFSYPYLNYWNIVDDGSLRDFGAEFVLKTPLSQFDLQDALEEFKNKTSNIQFIQNSLTTSVHVHVNMLHESLKTLINFICIYYMFEQTLLSYSGASRTSNLFCLSLKDADSHFESLLQFIEKLDDESNNSLYAIEQDCKYSSLNLGAIKRFGSLEIRCFRGTTDTDVIKDWVAILNDMLIYSKQEHVTPVTMLQSISKLGDDFFFEVFKETKVDLAPNYNSEEFFSALHYVSTISDLCQDWEHFSEVLEVDIQSAKFQELLAEIVDRFYVSNFEELSKSLQDNLLNLSCLEFYKLYGKTPRKSKQDKKKRQQSKVKAIKTLTVDPLGQKMAESFDSGALENTSSAPPELNLEYAYNTFTLESSEEEAPNPLGATQAEIRNWFNETQED